MESLEDKVSQLATSLEERNARIYDLEEEIVNNKVSFANSILKLNQSVVSSLLSLGRLTPLSLAALCPVQYLLLNVWMEAHLPLFLMFTLLKSS